MSSKSGRANVAARQRRLAAGMCTRCGVRPLLENSTRCYLCGFRPWKAAIRYRRFKPVVLPPYSFLPHTQNIKIVATLKRGPVNPPELLPDDLQRRILELWRQQEAGRKEVVRISFYDVPKSVRFKISK